jgi:cyclase
MHLRGHTRREALATVLGGTAALVLAVPGLGARAAAGQAASGDVTVLPLGEDLFVVRVPGEPNVVAFTADDGVVLVDGASAAGSPALLRAVADLPGGRPVRTLFNTHWHPEQTGSNETLGAAGVSIVAHENTRLWLTTDVSWPWDGRRFTRLPRVAQPNETFYTTGALAPGIRYGYIPDAAHTDGDLYVYFPEHDVLAVGDAVTGEGWPVVDWVTGGWIGGIVGGLQRLTTLAGDDTRIVPARGPVLRLSDLQAQLGMYSTLYERLTRLLNTGRSPDEAVAARPTKEFDDRMGPPDVFVRRAFESLWAYLSPDA